MVTQVAGDRARRPNLSELREASTSCNRSGSYVRQPAEPRAQRPPVCARRPRARTVTSSGSVSAGCFACTLARRFRHSSRVSDGCEHDVVRALAMRPAPRRDTTVPQPVQRGAALCSRAAPRSLLHAAQGSARARMPLALSLLAFLCAALGPRVCTAQTGVVTNLSDLQAAAFTGGTYVVVSSFNLTGSLTLNGTNTSLTLLGDTTACGGLCTLDANSTGGHFVVSMNYTLTVDSIAFVNSVRGRVGRYASEPCLGEVVRGSPGAGDALTISRNCAPYSLLRQQHLNDLPCGFLRCSSIIVAANASLFVNNSLFRNNMGYAGQFGALGASISIVATAQRGFSIENTQFSDNAVQDGSGGSWGNSGGAISVDQPFSGAMVYPVTFDRPLTSFFYPAPQQHHAPYAIALMQILNCTFTNNQAARGGALFLALSTGTLNITNCNFNENAALGTQNWLSALGGAIYVHMFTNSRPFRVSAARADPAMPQCSAQRAAYAFALRCHARRPHLASAVCIG